MKGGYEQVLNNYFIITYVCLMVKDKEYYVGKSNGFFKRAEFDMSAVLCALETYYNQDKYRDIDDKLNKL